LVDLGEEVENLGFFLWGIFFLVDCAAKSALIVNRKLQEQNLGAQIDFVPVLRAVRAVLFKLFAESSVEALVSSYDSGPSSDILSNRYTFEALNCVIFIDLGSLHW
jgi:hypothetical protein